MIFAGDQTQLLPTVLSAGQKSLLYPDRIANVILRQLQVSYPERMASRGAPVNTLTVQHRSTAGSIDVSNECFYNEIMEDAPETALSDRQEAQEAMTWVRSTLNPSRTQLSAWEYILLNVPRG